jgi:hypothetical protein
LILEGEADETVEVERPFRCPLGDNVAETVDGPILAALFGVDFVFEMAVIPNVDLRFV